MTEESWTREQFVAVGVALHGSAIGWQKALTARLGLKEDRDVRRWASGARPVPAHIQDAIMRLTGARELVDTALRRDEWIVGDGADRDGGRPRQYIVHAWPPRFIARVVEVDEDDEVVPDEADADTLTGVVYASEGYLVCEVQWIEPPPEGAALARLFDRACDFIDSGS